MALKETVSVDGTKQEGLTGRDAAAADTSIAQSLMETIRTAPANAALFLSPMNRNVLFRALDEFKDRKLTVLRQPDMETMRDTADSFRRDFVKATDELRAEQEKAAELAAIAVAKKLASVEKRRLSRVSNRKLLRPTTVAGRAARAKRNAVKTAWRKRTR
jgi:hypothetical protein